MKSFLRQLKEGILDNNPTLVQLLGMCPTLATTTSVQNALGMGLAATAVLIFSNLFVSLLRKFIPKQVRIAAYIVIISGFVTMVELLMKAYLNSLYQSPGYFYPADRGQLYHPGPCRGIRLQKQALALRHRRSFYGTWLHVRPAVGVHRP